MNSPFSLHIYWNTVDSIPYQYVDHLYSFFCHNSENPLDNYLGIPVFLYSLAPKIDDLQLESSKSSFHVFLIDDKMNLSEDWRIFTEDLLQVILSQDDNSHRIFPIAFNERALTFSEKIQERQFLRLYDFPENRKGSYLLIHLTREICRLLYQIEEKTKAKDPGLPIKLFLSYAKRDKEELAENLRNHIHTFNLNSFFDVNDITIGFQFSDELERHLKDAMLLAIHTDNYSSREWCRREILLAKKHNRPILVINRFKKGENRSFPYLGNVPHIHFVLDKDQNEVLLWDYIILEALREALKNKHDFLKTKTLAQSLNENTFSIYSYPPELISLLHLKDDQDHFLIYPDPPLGEEEIRILKTFRPNLHFLTPTLLPLLTEDRKSLASLSELKIGLSLSETNGSENAWIENRAIQDLMVDISRYLLVAGATLIYSGNMNYKQYVEKESLRFNFASLLADLVRTYRQQYSGSSQEIQAVENYSAYPYHELLTDAQKIDLRQLVKFIPVPPPESLNAKSEHASQVIKGENFDTKYVLAKSLTAMRKKMMEESNTQAWIIMGGKWIGFRGKMPGLLEEFLEAMLANKPIFLIGAFGGVTGGIINLLLGGTSDNLNLSFYKREFHSYSYFLEEFNRHPKTLVEERVDYIYISNKISEYGKLNEDFGLNNGLTKAENERLFHSKNKFEIIHLVLKGLFKICNK